MVSVQLFERLGVALAIGLLIGVERGWHERDARPGSRAAGIRTYALIGLLGGVWAAIGNYTGPLPLALAAGSFAGCFALFEWSEARASGTNSATGMVAGLLTFALGALAVFGATTAAAACAVAATLLLAERSALHTFVERLQWSELRSALILLVMTVVMLPLLPDRTVDPWNALNPHALWLMTAAIAALSYAGYVCVRLFGSRRGLVVGAAAAGLVSSTAVTLNYARLPRTDDATRAAIMAGILSAWAISLARVLAIATFIAPGIFVFLGPAVALGLAVMLAAAGFFFLRSAEGSGEEGQLLQEPFDLGLVLRFGLLLAVVVLVYKLALARFGDSGLYALAGISGIADVDPITLAVANSAGVKIPLAAAARMILLAATTNLVARVTILAWTRDAKFALPLVATGLAAFGAAWVAILVYVPA